MSREFKFRVYSFVCKEFIYFDIYDYPQGIAGGVSEPQQFTGLKDKNGNEIFEGDYIRGQFDHGPAGLREEILPVKWSNEDGYQWNYLELSTIGVIGNLFENPELFK